MHRTAKDVNPRRVAVMGRSGAGKTTIALAVGSALRAPVMHLDRVAWAPGWAPVTTAAFEAAQAAAVAGEAWVIGGPPVSGGAARAGCR